MNLRTHSWHPGGRWAENPQPVLSAVVSPGCPLHVGSAGSATEQKGRTQLRGSRRACQIPTEPGFQNWPCWASLMGEVGVVPGQRRGEFGFHKPHISHQKAKLCEDSPVVRGGGEAASAEVKRPRRMRFRWESLTWLPPTPACLKPLPRGAGGSEMDSWSCLRDREANRPASGSEGSLGQELPSGLGPPLLLPHLRACITTCLHCAVWGTTQPNVGPEPCSWQRTAGGVGGGGALGNMLCPTSSASRREPGPGQTDVQSSLHGTVPWAGEPSQHGPTLLSRTHRDRKEAVFAQGACKQLRASQPGRRRSGPRPSHLPGHIQGLGYGGHQWVPNTYLNECDP